MWLINEDGKREFIGGKSDFVNANKEALKCEMFSIDVDEEIVDDEEISCYNCRLRRWTEKSFVCYKIQKIFYTGLTIKLKFT